jgi:hypothetical protein
VREALDQRESKFDWSDTWLAEMFMSGKATELRKQEIERRMGITPEVKRYREIKAGVIVSSIGVGVAIFLNVFMRGIIPNASDDAAEILSRVWIAGIIPFLIGLALIINGVVVSKKLVEIAKRNQDETDELKGGPIPRELRPGDPSEFIPAGMSVTHAGRLRSASRALSMSTLVRATDGRSRTLRRAALSPVLDHARRVSTSEWR